MCNQQMPTAGSPSAGVLQSDSATATVVGSKLLYGINGSYEISKCVNENQPN